jgi:hypothetical protein
LCPFSLNETSTQIKRRWVTMFETAVVVMFLFNFMVELNNHFFRNLAINSVYCLTISWLIFLALPPLITLRIDVSTYSIYSLFIAASFVSPSSSFISRRLMAETYDPIIDLMVCTSAPVVADSSLAIR